MVTKTVSININILVYDYLVTLQLGKKLFLVHITDHYIFTELYFLVSLSSG